MTYYLKCKIKMEDCKVLWKCWMHNLETVNNQQGKPTSISLYLYAYSKGCCWTINDVCIHLDEIVKHYVE